MILPNIANYTSAEYAKSTTEKSIVEFKGLNLMPVIGKGEFSAMTNLSARNYPCLSPRAQRSVYESNMGSAASFIIVGDSGKTAYIKDNNFYYDGVSKGALDTAYSSAVRQLVEFQDRVLIWPDKMYYDITDDELGSLYASVSLTGLTFAASAEDSSLGDAVKYSSITSGTAISAFSKGDSITLSGCATSANNRNAAIDHISSDKKTLYFIENTFADATESGSVTLERKVPDMDYICVANNRLWGCKGNTIYGSKLGSAENWNYFVLNANGVSSSVDSYFLDVATDGSFTGCHQLGSYVVFLKENYIHKIIGTKPSNYQLSTMICPGLGLEAGSGKSIAYCSGALYYKSSLGITYFNGGFPGLVSSELGERWSGAVACTDGRRYYVSMTDGTAYSLLVYDTFYNAWHREDLTQVVDFAVYGGNVYMLTSTGTVYVMDDDTDGEVMAWSGTLGEFVENSAGKKIHSRLRLRAELPAASTLKVEYQADGGGWITAFNGSGAMRKSFYISIVPTRCDSFVVRLSGTGDCKIYQIDRIFSYSTDAR